MRWLDRLLGRIEEAVALPNVSGQIGPSSDDWKKAAAENERKFDAWQAKAKGYAECPPQIKPEKWAAEINTPPCKHCGYTLAHHHTLSDKPEGRVCAFREGDLNRKPTFYEVPKAKKRDKCKHCGETFVKHNSALTGMPMCQRNSTYHPMANQTFYEAIDLQPKPDNRRVCYNCKLPILRGQRFKELRYGNNLPIYIFVHDVCPDEDSQPQR